METQINQTILILKSPGANLASAIHFLSNRGWTIQSTDSTKDALKLLLLHKPDYLMISTNISDPSALKLGRILGKTLPLCVIYFSELETTPHIKKLEKTESPYKVFAPITGPAIERVINKYHKDLSHSKVTDFKKRDHTPEESEDNVIAIKGGRQNQTEKTSISAAYEKLNSAKLLSALESDVDELAVFGDETQNALNECVTPGDPKAGAPTPIKNSSNVACIIVESEKFSGYLIAAMGKNHRIDSAFIDRIREKLFNFLRSRGEDVDSGEQTLQLKIKEVDFEGWALDYAEFLKKSIHQGDEIAMAFFPYAEAKTRTGRSSNEDMASISLKEITSDVFLDFNVYLYLAKNDRYVLYTPKGGILYHHQKDKLLLQNIESLHVYKTDLSLVAALKAQSFLNEKVTHFETTKAANN